MSNLIRIFLLSLLFIILMTPLVIVKNELTFTSSTDTLFSIHRLLGLYAFSLIFLQIVLGSGRPLLGKFFNQVSLLRLHMSSGKIAFSVALAHPILLYATFFTEKNLDFIKSFSTGETAPYYYTGVLSLTLLFISVFAAIFRNKIGQRWIYLHRINYLIFWLIFFHSINIGVDVHTNFAQAVYWVYGTIVAVLTIRKTLILIKPILENKQKAPSR